MAPQPVEIQSGQHGHDRGRVTAMHYVTKSWDGRLSLKRAIICPPNHFHLGVSSDYTVIRGGSHDRGGHAHYTLIGHKCDRITWLTTPMAGEL
jgi:hypothetical protein